MEIIDAYSHCGLDKYEPVERVRQVMQSAGVSRAVLVQHLGQYDNGYLARVAADDSEHLAATCLVDHRAPDACDVLQRLAATGQFRGVRLTTHALAECPRLFDRAAEARMVIVLYSPEGLAPWVEPLKQFLDQHADAHLVITHLGNPAPDDAARMRAHRQVFELAAHGGVWMQLSGMAMFCPYPHERLYDFVAEAFDRFGPHRICWGSNYPVVGGDEEYRLDLGLLVHGRLPLPPSAIPAIAGGNARRLWFN